MSDVIYRAPEDTPHHCSLKNYEHLPQTSIVRCGECGTYWERKDIIGEWRVHRWRRVTRWNRKARRRIREAPKPHVHDGHCILSCAPAQTLTNKVLPDTRWKADDE